MVKIKKGPLRGESYTGFRTQCAIMNMIPCAHDPSTPCHLCHSQNFDKIDSFIKPILNICILGNLIVG